MTTNSRTWLAPLLIVALTTGLEPALAQEQAKPKQLRGKLICGPSLIKAGLNSFSDFVSLTVDGNRATWTRDNPATKEVLTGSIDKDGGISFVGEGRRADGTGAPWISRFTGKLTGDWFDATGGTETPDGKTRTRDCTVSLAAPTLTSLNYVDGATTYKLETAIFHPAKANGQFVIFNHGSTGGNAKFAKISYAPVVPPIARMLTDGGFTVVMWMRKGRGTSEGDFTEETGSCAYGKLIGEQQEAYDQLGQVVSQVKKQFGVQKVILMGHSRGGYLSATYAAAHPDEVSHVVNLSGVWSAFCEKKSGLNHEKIKIAAQGFKPQYWVYAERDTYFDDDRFGDPDYRWLSSTAEENTIAFKKIGSAGFEDGHSAPLSRPDLWAKDVILWLAK